MLIVPCLVLMSACGGGSTYKLDKIKITTGEGESATTTEYKLADYKAKLKADYIKELTSEDEPTPTQIAAATLYFENQILGRLVEDFAEAAIDLLEIVFDNFDDYEIYYMYDFTIWSMIRDTLSDWNVSGVGAEPTGTPTITDYINAVKGTNMTALAEAIYAVDDAAFTTTTLDTEAKSVAAIKAVLDRLNVANTATLHAKRISNFDGIWLIRMLEGIESAKFVISGSKITITSCVVLYSEEIFSGQAKHEENSERKSTVNFTKDSTGAITLSDPLMQLTLKEVGKTIELTSAAFPGTIFVFKK